ncbi:MAG: sugar transferase [Lachnospiraceae bacterium]|jgi:lipopolysaccharide/colanic/teichoic acid biosynthesis glycosyltransferase|nr:sugar transferase [Lachnospiraceae bacterium]MCH4063774.1 sugar transferase [Lachnospiraceae bacterium]MCH4103503.1 sugar transferase [Lachnospiraceae bacterium]MCI1309856.1 sugar transferase [Lachnospiraceae bacterium]MCI1334307.1 sugar transferase [Lachnospiraceae bacterium]
MKRRHLEFEIAFFSYLLTAIFSGMLAIIILFWAGRLTAEFFSNNVFVSVILPLIIAGLATTVFMLHKTNYHFRKMSVPGCMSQAFKETVFFGCALVVLLVLEKNGVTDSRYWFITTLIINFIGMTLEYVYITAGLIKSFRTSPDASFIGIVTNSRRAEKVVHSLRKDWARRIVGVCLVDGGNPSDIEGLGDITFLATPETLLERIQREAIDEVFIEIEENERPLVMPVVREMIRMGIRVHINLPEVQKLEREAAIMRPENAASASDANAMPVSGTRPKNVASSGTGSVHTAKADSSDRASANSMMPSGKGTVNYQPAYTKEIKYGIDGRPALILDRPRKRMIASIMKRALDIIGSIIGLAIFGIIFIILAPIIKLDSPGPVIFAQTRIGKNGRKFRMYKFRSMYQDAEKRKQELLSQNEMNGLMFKMENDPRVTKVGRFIRKTSLDEFPQFWNVFKGDMSLVGTRPPTVGEFNQYNSYHKRRLSMKPGMTGLWQVSGRSDIKDFDEVVRLDCQYIDNWSVGGDIKIIAKTVMLAFKKDNGAK